MNVEINSGKSINASVGSSNITAIATFGAVIISTLIATCILTPQIEIQAQITPPLTANVTIISITSTGVPFSGIIDNWEPYYNTFVDLP